MKHFSKHSDSRIHEEAKTQASAKTHRK